MNEKEIEKEKEYYFDKNMDVFTNEDLNLIEDTDDYQLIDDDIERLEEFLSKEDIEEWE